MRTEENLKKLNINLPKAPDPVGAYVASKIVGNLIFNFFILSSILIQF